MAATLKFGNGNWATKEGSTLAYNDQNDNYKPLPFDFSRASKATVINKAGLIETVGAGEPRIDFKDNTKGSLLLEPQRSNLVTYSEDFSQSVWGKSGSSVISNTTISPDGTLNAEKITESNSSSKHQIFTSISSYTELTISFFAKKEERSFISVEKSSWGSTIFDLNNGSVVSGIGNVVYFGNGWYRCSATYTASTPQSQFYIILMKDGSTNNYQGDGVSGLYLWGVQAEVGSYATSYIPTSGSAVTRLADSSSQTPPDGVIGQTEGTIFLNLSWTEIASNIYYVYNDGTASNRILIYSTSETEIFVLIQSGGITSASFSINGQNTRVLNKIAVSYKNNDFKVALNGVIKGTDTSGNAPLGINYIDFFLYGEIAENKLYNTALTDQELIALTS